MFKKAERKQLRLRAAIDGPSGSGKTATACRFALSLSPNKKIAVIDSEHGSASKYAGQDFGEGPIEFDVLELSSFSPSNYTAAIQEAGRLGYEVIIVDSLSHAWEGKDGALELVDKAGGNSFTAWKDVTPMHRNMIEAILASPAHVVCTMRSKTEFILEEQEKNGKKIQVPRKVGMAPVQRQGMEYEFDVYLSMDWSHIATVTKSRCPAIDGAIAAKPGREFLQPVIQWLETGSQPAEAAAPAAKISNDQLSDVAKLLGELGWKTTKLDKELPKRFSVTSINDLDATQAGELIKWLAGEKKLAAEKAERAKASAVPAANGVTPPVATAEQSASATPSPSVPSQPAPQQPQPTNGAKLSEAQVKDIRELKLQLFGHLSADEHNQKWAAILAKRNVTSAMQLSPAQADELIKSMTDAVLKVEQQKKSQGLNDWVNQQVGKNLASGQQRPAETAATGKA